MIIFKDDWIYKHPGAIADFDTNNKSFLEMAYKLKHVGVENHLFFLALYNPELAGVDPFSDSLTLAQMTAIGIECKQNPWFSFRCVFKAPPQAGITPDPVSLNRANLSLWWSFFNHITYGLTQPRQTGKSFSTDILMTQLMNFTCANSKINLLTKDDILRAANVKRLKEIYEELPSYLNFKNRTDASNTEALTVNRFNNTYTTHVPQSSPKNAYKVGRGLSTPIFHVDEAPFQPNIEIAMGSALGAMGAACELAEKNGEPYGVIITTTAGKKDDPSGKYIYNYLQDAALWSDKFYDAKDINELQTIVRSNSRKGNYRVYGVFNHRQLGKDDKWLKDQLERTDQNPDDANRDFFNVWTSGSLTSPIPTHLAEKLARCVQEPNVQEFQKFGKYMLRWYVPENQILNYKKNKTMAICVDTSDGAGGDDLSAYFVDVESGETVAVGSFNTLNLIVFSQWLASIVEDFEKSVLVIERRSSAITILDNLFILLPAKGIDPFKRIFNWVVNDPIEHKELYRIACEPMRRRPEDIYIKAKKYFGFATSGGGQTSRSELYSTTLINALKRCADKVKDITLTNQINGLVIKNGRVDHADGEHDDLVIAFLLGHWFMNNAKNLSFYGIDPLRILVQSREKVFETPTAAYKELEQQKIREDLTHHYELLVNCRDSFIRKRIEEKMRFLESKLILKDDEHFSLDALLKELDQNRKKSY